ncbi:hypothetical protein CsSME_00031663 [Camellia sinensis var. sinensis]
MTIDLCNQFSLSDNSELAHDDRPSQSTLSLGNSELNPSEPKPKPLKPPRRKNDNEGGRTPSTVWDHFDKVFGTDGKRRAVYKYCKKEYLAESRLHGTSNLRSHILNCKEYPNKDKDGQQTLNLKPKQNEKGC